MPASSAIWALLAIGPVEPAATTTPAVRVRLVRPGEQVDRVVALFRGTRAAHPAEALSAWKRGAGPGEVRSLGKAGEAAIAACNPLMARELDQLDDAALAIRFDPAGSIRWSLAIPHDDGTFAALAPALALTDGGPEPPLGPVAVDRLGPAGSPLSARVAGTFALASDRDGLAEALATPTAGPPPIQSGWAIRADPDAIKAGGTVALRRAGQALELVGGAAVEATVGIEGDALAVAVAGPSGFEPVASVDPVWLAIAPAGRTSAVFAMAIPPGSAARDAAFAAVDRIERADPARAGLAPARVRLNLIAAGLGLNLEADLWPGLRGISACTLAGPSNAFDGAVVALHFADEPAAARVADRVIPRLAARIGRPLDAIRRGSSVTIGWGKGALDDPGRSEGPGLVANWGGSAPERAGACWPGRLPGLPPSVLARALVAAPPVAWTGRTIGGQSLDVARWPGLAGLVRRFLDDLPMAGPDREGSR